MLLKRDLAGNLQKVLSEIPEVTDPNIYNSVMMRGV